MFSTAGIPAQAEAPMSNEEALYKIQYYQGELEALGVKVAINFDWKGISEVQTLNNLPEERVKHAAFLIGQTGDGFCAVARGDEEVRKALAADVKKIRILHAPKLKQDPAVSVKDGVATVRFNYSKYQASNVGPEMRKLIYEALPSATAAERNRQRKVVDELLVRKTKSFRADELVDLKLEVRWKEFEGEDAAVLKGLERFVDRVADNLSDLCGYNSSKLVLKEKVNRVSFGLLKKKDAPPVEIRLTGKTLSVALPVQTLSEESSAMSMRNELMVALGIRELKNR
jgi:hypothetical protein